MRKLIINTLTLILLICLCGCDTTYVYSLDISCDNQNVNILIDDELHNSYKFSNSYFNHNFQTRYSYIDFKNYDIKNLDVKIYNFAIMSSIQDNYTLSLKLVNPNNYVIDFLRVGIVIDDELRVYKYYDPNETIYHKEDDPSSILHFKSVKTIFNDLSIMFMANEIKTITIFVWSEEAELYDASGNRLKGWSDKSYYANPIDLTLEIKNFY